MSDVKNNKNLPQNKPNSFNESDINLQSLFAELTL